MLYEIRRMLTHLVIILLIGLISCVPKYDTNTKERVATNKDIEPDQSESLEHNQERFFFEEKERSTRVDTLKDPEVNFTLIRRFVTSDDKSVEQIFNEQLMYLYKKLGDEKSTELKKIYKSVDCDDYKHYGCSTCYDCYSVQTECVILYVSTDRISIKFRENAYLAKGTLETFYNYKLHHGSMISITFYELFDSQFDVDSLNYCGSTGEVYYGDLKKDYEDPYGDCFWFNFGIESENRHASFTFVDEGIAVLYPIDKSSTNLQQANNYRIIKYSEMQRFWNMDIIKRE